MNLPDMALVGETVTVADGPKHREEEDWPI
jgi:hypothetical protein